MHRLEKNILHHAKQNREFRKYKLNYNGTKWQPISKEPINKKSITLYNDDLTIKGKGYY
ncbi:hypothetical protein [uncultured Mediterranean phage uvDeep1-CGR2-KM23-C896]|nr:hypothetical protein [uncultured Mediterranean phage uvDeep1-CGR2-KM23-C896]